MKKTILIALAWLMVGSFASLAMAQDSRISPEFSAIITSDLFADKVAELKERALLENKTILLKKYRASTKIGQHYYAYIKVMEKNIMDFDKPLKYKGEIVAQIGNGPEGAVVDGLYFAPIPRSFEDMAEDMAVPPGLEPGTEL